MHGHLNFNIYIYIYNHKHQGLDPLIRSVSRVTAARANASSVFQLFSFLVVCSCMISKGFGFVAFFASVKASSVCIYIYIYIYFSLLYRVISNIILNVLLIAQCFIIKIH